MAWLSQSPDFNPIERLWGEFQRGTQGIQVKNADEKLDILCQACARIPQFKNDNTRPNTDCYL